MYRFQLPTDSAVGGMADDGRGKLTLVAPPAARAGSPAPLCRDGAAAALTEHDLLDHIARVVRDAGLSVPRALLVDYYVSLKTNPFVVLAGRPGAGKADFAAAFAEALLGRGSPQYALIPGGASWTGATGERGYFRAVLDRFASLRFLDLLQDAASPSGAGKAYLVCFSGLRPEEFSYYFTSLLRVDDAGRQRLALPGVPVEQAPIIPPNVSITATVNTTGYEGALNASVLRNAALIQFGRPLKRIPGRDAADCLHFTPELEQLLWRGGMAPTERTIEELSVNAAYVAGSFDARGVGLFDPADALRNVAVAVDAQVVQRVLWKLHSSDDAELRRDLARYLNRLGPAGWHQAVA